MCYLSCVWPDVGDLWRPHHPSALRVLWSAVPATSVGRLRRETAHPIRKTGGGWGGKHYIHRHETSDIQKNPERTFLDAFAKSRRLNIQLRCLVSPSPWSNSTPTERNLTKFDI